MSKLDKKVSIICPVFNEEDAIPLFYNRLKSVLLQIPGYDFELIFTNNQSTDRSLEKIRELVKQDDRVRFLTFSRNFGYQASVLAGISHAQGDAIIVIDVDCEDPPELIPAFIEKWQQGHDICYGIRGKRQEAKVITMLRLLFYRVLKAVADTDIILDMAEFCLMSRRVRNEIIKNVNTFPFLRAEIAYSGFRKIGIPYDRQERIIGTSKYNLWRMTLFAVAGILSVSTFPLRLPIYLWPLVVLINIVVLALDYVGIASIYSELMVLNVLYIISLITAQGLYIARIYKNAIARPVYIIDWDQSDLRLNV